MKERTSQTRQKFIEDLLSHNFTTYFAATHPEYSKGNPAYRFTPSPVSPAVPYSWSYSEARTRLMALADLLTADEAERRNINFVNPGLKEFMPAATLPTLRGGIQLLLPDEKAYAHRHTANAFRLILEAPQVGAYTNVEGFKLPMSKGDLILTPNWTWHDHHNESDANTIWYDGLDVLVAYFIGAVFFQEMVDVTGQQYQTIARDADEITNAFGSGLLQRRKIFPDNIPTSDNTLLYYPYRKARQQLFDLSAASAGNAADGVLLEYVNPVSGGSTFPTMSASLRLVDGKSSLEAMHRTENVIFITLEGSLTVDLLDGRTFVTQAHDVTAIPSWIPYSIRNTASEPAIVFSQSDRPVFQALGFYRESPV
jgi:gentisate 1,2-dioxygenase